MKKDILKKIAFVFIVVVLSCMASLSFSMFKFSSEKIEYIVTFNENVMIEKISLNSNDIPLKSFVGDSLSLDKEKKLLKTSEKVDIVLDVNVVDDLYVKFSGNSEDITVLKDGIVQELNENSYLNVVGIKEILTKSISATNILYFVIALPIFIVLMFGLKYVYKKVIEDKLKFYDILLYIGIVFLMFLFTYYAFSLLLRKFIFLPVALFIGYGIYLVCKMPNKKYESIYVVLSVIASVAMIFVMAPFNVPDEASHFLRAYKESYVITEYDGGFHKFPKAITEFIYKYNRNLHDTTNKLYSENYLSEFTKSVDYSIESKYETDYRNVVDLSVIPYIPAAGAILVARTMHLSPLVMFLLSRLLNLTITVLACYWAIKKMPHFKRILTIVCLFPIFIQQSVAINMDYFTNAIIIMLVSLIFQMIYSVEKIGKREIILLTIFSIGLILGKFGYFPVLALLFLVPKDKFNNRVVEWIIKIGFIIVVLASSLLINLGLATEQGTAPGQGLEVYGIKSFFTSPFTAIKVIMTTVLARIDQDVLRGFFDNFAYSTAANKAIFSISMYFVYILLLFSKDEEDVVELPKVHRIIYIGVSIAIIAIVYAIAYSQWTSKGAAEISGLQARYFIATSSLLYIGATNSLLNINVKNKKVLYTVLMATSLIISILTIGNFFS